MKNYKYNLAGIEETALWRERQEAQRAEDIKRPQIRIQLNRPEKAFQMDTVTENAIVILPVQVNGVEQVSIQCLGDQIHLRAMVESLLQHLTNMNVLPEWELQWNRKLYEDSGHIKNGELQ